MIKKISASLFILFFCFLFYLQFQVITNQDFYEPKPSDAIIILGHAIDENNNPGDWLIQRLEAGLSLYRNNFAKHIIVTGGKGHNDNIAVSLSMKQWLLDQGIPEEAILTEQSSHNTYENFKYSKEICVEKNINSIVVVTNDFHNYRSNIIARDYFDIVSGYSTKTQMSVEKFFAYLKEPLSIIKYYVTDIIVSS